MLLAYGGQAVGAGLVILMLLALSSLLTGILAGHLTYAHRISVRRLCTVTIAIECVIGFALSMCRGINPEFFATASSRTFGISLLLSGMPIGIVLGGLGRVLRAAVSDT